jgi:hypothetical protein
LEKIETDSNLNIVEWAKRNFVSLVFLGGLALYLLGVIKP